VPLRCKTATRAQGAHRLYQPSLPERSLPMASYSVPPAMNSAATRSALHVSRPYLL